MKRETEGQWTDDLLRVTISLARARRKHREAKDRGANHLGTGADQYAAEQEFERVTQLWLDSQGE